MKPESVERLIACYLSETPSTSHYDEADGLSPVSQSLLGKNFKPYVTRFGGESLAAYEERITDLLQYHAVVLDPQPELENHFAPLDPQERGFRGIGRRLREIANDFEMNHRRAIGNQFDALGSSKMIQFNHRCMLVAPSCGHIEIPVVRMGSARETANVAWKTLDKTAIEGTHYRSKPGVVSFAEGEQEKTVEIEIIRNQEDSDVSFVVELFNPERTEVGAVNPLTVYITDHSNLYDDERQVVENIINCGNNNSISNIAWCLGERITAKTFKAALQFVCSNANSIPEELALGLELMRVSLESAPLDQLSNVVCNFFNHLPELEDIVQNFDGFN